LILFIRSIGVFVSPLQELRGKFSIGDLCLFYVDFLTRKEAKIIETDTGAPEMLRVDLFISCPL
jgi:hypothetical protein